MSLWDYVRTGVRDWLFSDLTTAGLSQADQERLRRYSMLQAYQRGAQRPQLRTRPNQVDDNLIINWCGLVVERSISMMLGDGISFDLPGDPGTPQDEVITRTWDANRQGILLHKAAQYAATFGTGYLKILPGAAYDRAGQEITKLVTLNPYFMTLATAADDMDNVVAYTQTYETDENGQRVGHRIVTARSQAVAIQADGSFSIVLDEYGDAWTETHFINSRATGGKWAQRGDVIDWPYSFAPIVHWQNLPDASMPYGLCDFEDVIGTQDRYNFNASNISKIIRYHAHPRQYTIGTGKTGVLSWAPDEVMQFPPGAEVKALEMASDLESSRAFGGDLREALFTVTRTTDPATIKDTIGALTNFGLRVLFKDELHKNSTKRQLLGDALLEVNHRLLRLAGFDGEDADPGAISWPDELPTDDVAQSQAITADIGNGLVSRETASTERGYDWEQESERMQAGQAQTENVGAAILRAFSQGRGAPAPAPTEQPPAMQQPAPAEQGGGIANA